MTAHILLLILISIVVFGFLFDQWLDYLNTTTWNNALPESLKGLYDEETYRKQQDYQKVNRRISLITDCLSFVLILMMLTFGGFAWLDKLVSLYTTSPVWQALLFFGSIALFADLLNTPFDLYDTFVIEERFGFNTTTLKTYIFDKFKGWLLALLVGGGFLAIIVLIYEKAGSWFWILAWLVVTFFTLFVGYFYTTLLVPLFNKLSPLPDGELRNAIEKVALSAEFSLRNIFIMDGSKRSTKGNAYFSGFGRKKSIVIFDTLMNEYTSDELASVLAHEIGHYKKKHVLKGIFISIIQTGVLLFILSLLLKNPLLAGAMGDSVPSFHLGLVAFGLLYTPVSMLLGIGLNWLSRKHEFEADHFAAELTRPDILQLALKKLSVKNLSNLTPHPWYVFVNYSHPSLLQRLEALDTMNTHTD